MSSETLAIVFETAGGLGLFLLGMIIMTAGLKELAGEKIRTALIHFTHSPLSGAITGATATAILQSSSATTVTAIGFVSANLLSFPMALGIIFGANVGTTVTGWLVTFFGFKLKLGLIALPLVLTGSLLKLFVKGWLSTIGYTLAGFSLIFIGISTLQSGMAGLPDFLSPDNLPQADIFGRLQLVAIGILVTIITQSSSAGVAATLTALFAGAVNFEQAVCLVIGMDIGTTFTAVIATIGGSTEARRTGFSHVIFNLFSGAFALILVVPYTQMLVQVFPNFFAANPGISLVIFHTGFNVLGVIMILPFAHQFANLIIFLFPEKEGAIARQLDKRFLQHPEIALMALKKVVLQVFAMQLTKISNLKGEQSPTTEPLAQTLQEARLYADKIHLKSNKESSWNNLIAIIHALDHLDRLEHRCSEDWHRAQSAMRTPLLVIPLGNLISVAQTLAQEILDSESIQSTEKAKHLSDEMATLEPKVRAQIIDEIGSGELDLTEGRSQMESMRWIKRVSSHIQRITDHLNQAELELSIQAKA